MASNWYNNGLLKVVDGTIDLVADTIRVLLVDASYTFDAAAHVHVSDITGEIATTAYVRKDLAGKAVSAVANVVSFLADNVTWTAIGPPTAGPTAAKCIVYKFVTNDAGSLLIAAIDFPDQTFNGSDFTEKWNGAVANGAVFTVTG
jgi:hypothetical protein